MTEEHRTAIEDAIKQIDFELGRCGDEGARALNRQRAHLVAELAAGQTLPFDDEEYSAQLAPETAGSRQGSGTMAMSHDDGLELTKRDMLVSEHLRPGSIWRQRQHARICSSDCG
ncbi:MAG: hypothetical protein K2X55_15410 [Burkholderiaceae bacterium]|nr:hypothetical protein [Burkholderiaceae bacterium]